jgi:hypothetical protein
VLGARHTDRDWKAKLYPHPGPNRACNFGWRTEEMGAPSDGGEGFIDRNLLDERRKIIEHLDGGMAAPSA